MPFCYDFRTGSSFLCILFVALVHRSLTRSVVDNRYVYNLTVIWGSYCLRCLYEVY